MLVFQAHLVLLGEFMVILGALQANFWYAFLAAMTLIIGAAYTLWMVKACILGDN